MISPLDISTKYYFWKAYMAYFEAFELKAYRDFVEFPDGLILDLGCGDGTFAQMLKELLGFKTPLIGVDYDRKRLLRAAQRGSVYSQVSRVDVKYLPFQEESFDTVFANQVLYYVRPNPGQAIREIKRILKKGGELICTVPTNLAAQHYYLAEVLKRMGLVQLEHWYRRRINSRFFNTGTTSSFSVDRWTGTLEESGLSVINVVPYISGAISCRWSLLAIAPFRAIGVLRTIPSKRMHRLASMIQKHFMMRSYSSLSTAIPPECGDHVLIVSKKADNGEVGSWNNGEASRQRQEIDDAQAGASAFF